MARLSPRVSFTSRLRRLCSPYGNRRPALPAVLLFLQPGKRHNRPHADFLLGAARSSLSPLPSLHGRFVFGGLHGVMVRHAAAVRKTGIIISRPCSCRLDSAGLPQSNMGFLALPWASLGHSQHGSPSLIQIASYTGEYGVTFMVMLVNVSLAQVFLTRRYRGLAITATVFTAIVFWGWTQLDRPATNATIRVAAIQPARPKRIPGTGSGNQAAIKVLEKLTAESALDQPDLFVWPEAVLDRWKQDPDLIAQVIRISETYDAPIVMGVAESQKFVQPDTDGKAGDGDRLISGLHNSAFYIGPDHQIVGPYNKNLLVPFSEYLPLARMITWPKWIVQTHNDLTPGHEYIAFGLPSGVRAIPIICWENLFADFVRRAVVKKSCIILHLVNDNWFGPTAAPWQHTAASVLRAVENRTPVVIASNTGPSQVIDAQGCIAARVPELFTTGVAMADIVPGIRSTFYTRNGDVSVFIVALIFIGGFGPMLMGRSFKPG